MAISLSGSLEITGSIFATGGITGSFSGIATSASYSDFASNALSSSYAATSSFANDLTVAGTITAQKLVVQQVTSSVIYSSGSNVFGNSLSNTQSMTGSVSVTGSLTINGVNTNLSAYLPLSGGTLTGALGGTSATFSGAVSLATSSGNVMVGTGTPLSVPNYKIVTVNGTSGSGYATQTNGALSLYSYSNAVGSVISEQRNLPLFLETNNTIRATLNGSGNLGLGVTPSAWNDGFVGFEIKNSANNLSANGGSYFEISQNATWNSGWKYVNTARASRYEQGLGEHFWFTAPSGTAGNAISFTQAMTLNASGNLSIGNTNDTFKLDVTGTGRFTGQLTMAYSGNPRLILQDTDSGAGNVGILFKENTSDKWTIASASNSLILFNEQGAGTALTLSSTNAATFSSSVTAQGPNDGTALFLQRAGGANVLALNTNSNGSWTMFDYASDSYSAGITQKSGNVGIGTTAPGAKLDIVSTGTGSEGLRIDGAAGGFAFVVRGGSTYTTHIRAGATIGVNYFTTPPVNGLIVEGNVGIGTTSPTDSYSFGKALDVSGVNGAALYFRYSTDPTVQFGMIGYDRTGQGLVLATNNALPILFNTSATERMRITSGGNVLIGCTAVPSSSVEGFIATGRSSGNSSSSGATSAAYNHFLFYNSNGIVGSISTAGTTTTYSVTSDYRLKQDLQDYNGLNLLSKIKTYDYQWKSDKSRMYGVLAHELKEVLPYAVVGEKDGQEMQSVDYSKLVPVLVKAIQELKAEIDILKNK
jgi:hypothetical protein